MPKATEAEHTQPLVTANIADMSTKGIYQIKENFFPGFSFCSSKATDKSNENYIYIKKKNPQIWHQLTQSYSAGENLICQIDIISPYSFVRQNITYIRLVLQIRSGKRNNLGIISHISS